ncbi:glycosyltransferase [Ornithinimicrobium cryptoxanthini]|uniref:Glycosyltransferase n=1 Tax=Ornithinimicrobium cryptoxanthini TaxID=2934161 RepID=A0ABY4YHK4_9MICO|nr:glycosyltransferase [Ornithinimicrobium cryptoxanthini]USQ76112.1 glycosyltransferase [Ornithinimicrobium cryptoxanthini]
MDLPTCLLARLHGKRLVLEVNGGLGDVPIAHPRARTLAPLLRLLARTEFRLAHSVICVSPGLQAWVRRTARGHTDVRWARNGADPELVRRRRSAAVPAYACFVGVLAGWQGIELLLAASASPHWPQGVGLQVVGDGQHAGLVRHAARKLPHIRYHGRLPRDRALEVLAASSVSLCLPTSDLERNQINGIPFKLLDSLVLGVPAVVSPLRQQTNTVLLAQGGITVEETARHVALAVADLVGQSRDSERRALSTRSAALLSWEYAIDTAEAAVAPAG